MFFIRDNNKGSALIYVFMILFTITFLGITLITVTMSNARMSNQYNDSSVVYFIAESGAAIINKNISNEICVIQDAAQNTAQTLLAANMNTDPNAYTNSFGALDSNLVASAYNTYYNSAFDANFSSYWSSIIQDSNGTINASTRQCWIGGLDPNANTTINGCVITLLNTTTGIQSPDGNYYIYAHINGTGKQGGVSYTKNINIELQVLKDASSQPYQVVFRDLSQTQTKCLSIPNMLINKTALCAQKNIIFANHSGATTESINVFGDVIAFGIIPYIGSVPNLQEDWSATWNEYGGVLFGMSTDVSDSALSLGADRASYYGLNTNLPCDANIVGNIATMGSIEVLYNDDPNGATINLGSDNQHVFARSILLGVGSTNTGLTVNGNAHVLGQLNVIGLGDNVSFNKDYYGMVKSYTDIGGDSSSYDFSQEKATSSVVVSGNNSTLQFNGGLYVGGEVFLDCYDPNNNDYMYLSGLSVIKDTGYINNAYMYPLNVYNGVDTNVPATYANYISTIDGNDNVLMITGILNGENPLSFLTRASHFKNLWVQAWENDPIKSQYVDLSSITVTKDPNYPDLVIGYSTGTVIADDVYAPSDFSYDYNYFSFYQPDWINDYKNAIKDFIIYTDSLDTTLNYVTPNTNVMSYFDTSQLTVNSDSKMNIATSSPSSVFYGTGNWEINYNGSQWQLVGTSTIPLINPRGIIVIDGDLYIDTQGSANAGFVFEGLIVASGNIVVKGSCSITRNTPDTLGTSDIVYKILNQDLNVYNFFKLQNSGIINYAPVTSTELVNIKCTKVVNWQEE